VSDVPHDCAPALLRLDRINADAGAGQRGIEYAFTNTGMHRCTLTGHPRITLLGDNGRVPDGVTTRMTRGMYFAAGYADTVAALPPGMRAVFAIGYTGIPADGKPCAHITSVVIAPPSADSTAAGDTVPEQLDVCVDRQVRVGPVAGGFAAVAGTYMDTLPAADAPGRIVRLRLLPDSTAMLETDFEGRSPLAPVRGRWMLNSDTIVAMHPSDSTRKPLLWRPRGRFLLPLAWDTTLYGHDGLPLTRRY
jgi:hypothetical protein